MVTVRRFIPSVGLVTTALVASFAVIAVFAAPSLPADAATTVRIEDGIVVHSSDGTPIVATLMLPGWAKAATPVPAILMTHGWAGSRETAPAGITTRLLNNGYAILSWDSRGQGESGGEANIGAPGFEVRDAKALISYLASRPEIKQDGPDDPRVGWIGGSNGGGVQLNTVALDDRVEAIVPEISWGNLLQDLVPGGVVKESWVTELYGSGLVAGTSGGLLSPAGPQPGAYAPQLHQAFVEAMSTGSLSQSSRDWLAVRSTTARSADIRTPTLILQGTVDGLFPLQDGFQNFLNIASSGTPAKLIAYCRGHSACPYPGNASGYPEGAGGRPPVYQDRIVAWLNRYVKNKSVDTGPTVEWQAQDGRYYGAPSYPLPQTITVDGKPLQTGTLVGPVWVPRPGGVPGTGQIPGRTTMRAVVVGAQDQPRSIVGVPTVQLNGTVSGVRAHVFLELVDVAPDGTRVTVDEQVAATSLAGGAVNEKVDLHGVAWRLEAGHDLMLEISTGSDQYAIPRTGPYSVSLSAALRLPVSPG